jgi:hypothetical protein
MKKIIGLFFAVLFSAGLYAQEGVIKFLGIPVDGTKQEMIQKLKTKGFTYNQRLEALEGEFNGEEVLIQVQTQNNKVWRLVICDKNLRSKGQIRLRFNELVGQFENNGKYTPFMESQTIDENEDIDYEITVKDKQYRAVFIPNTTRGAVYFTICTNKTKYFIAMYYENINNAADGSDL